jgi:Caspase domain
VSRRFGGAKLWLAVSALAAPAYAQQACAVSKDLVVRALEMVSATPARDQLADGLLLLKQAEESCDENGDAWYYRSLFERKLGQGNPQYSLGKARERNSAALRSEDDPFHLATPARGVQAAPVANSGAAGVSHSTRDSRKPDVSHKWALVIGIAAFQDHHLNLQYTRKDADAVSALLKDPVYGRFPADHVKLIEDEQATTVNIRAGLNWLARQASEDDLALIYIASHGTARDQDEAGASYVVTFDTDVESRDGLYSTSIPLVEISNVVRTRVKALKAVVILDICHSQGAVSQTITVPASMPPQMQDRIREGTGRVIMGASQSEESSFESPKYGHGLFTYYLLQGLKDQKDAPLEKIYAYVSAHVTQDAAANGWKQHPFLSVSEGQSPVVLGIAASPLAWLCGAGNPACSRLSGGFFERER